MTPAKTADVILSFRAENAKVPVACRVKRLLKFAGRVCGLTCVSINQLPDERQPTPSPPANER